ncbi:hypothetical protein DXT97_22030 [Agrobacterium tumefaciens]|nr:hypothetical protein [Agrobacterium tumefaciens]OVE90299.1 hypothetical protein B7W89_12745 [Agrobacterium tumefaciens]
MMCLPRCCVSLRGILTGGRGVGMSGDGLFFVGPWWARLTPSALPGISPSTGEIDSRAGFAHLSICE